MSRSRVTLFGIIAAVLILVLATTSVFLWGVYHRHWEGSFVTGVANVLPVSAARVGGRKILLRDYFITVTAIKQYLASPEVAAQQAQDPHSLTDEDRKNALEQLMEEAAVEELAAARNIAVTDTEVDQAIDMLKTQLGVTATSTEAFTAYVHDTFGWSLEDLKKRIVRPGLLRTRAATSYAGDHGGDLQALNGYLEERLQRPDAVRYVRF